MNTPGRVSLTGDTAKNLLVPALLVIAIISLLTGCLPGILCAKGHGILGGVLRRWCGLFCHQDPARCFQLAGQPLAICARCFGANAGVVLGSFCGMFIQLGFRVRSTTGAALLLIAAGEWLAEWLGWWHGTNSLRFMAGLIGGLGIVILPQLETFWTKLRQNKSRCRSTSNKTGGRAVRE